jgi:protein-S-isoprenylcysteine O-methyltransferase Ste14
VRGAPLSYIVVIAGIVIFASYMAAGRIFLTPEKMPRGMLLILLLSVPGLLSFIYFTTGQPHSGWMLLAALALLLLSAALFAWTIKSIGSHGLNMAFVDFEPAGLLTRGAFHYIRHPLYLAYILYWIGATAASMHWSTFLIGLALVILYVAAARREENIFLASELAGAYHHYQKRAGFLWPCLL